MSVLSVLNVSKAFGDNEVLKDISFEVQKGEVIAIIGPSGSGKSTLLRCLTTLETIDQGTVSYGSDILVRQQEGGERAVYADKETLQKIRGKFGLVFQNFNLFPHLSVLENIMISPAKVHKQEKQQVFERAQALLDKMDLRDKANAYPYELSGGQQQRVAIARALASEARVLLADEPTGNLDENTAGGIIELLKRTAHELGKCVIVVTHSRQVAEEADEIVELRDGGVYMQ